MDLLESVCSKLSERKFERVKPPPSKSEEALPSQPPVETLEIDQVKLEALLNFTRIYTDVLQTEDVLEQFEESKYTDLQTFEKDNVLYNIGFFYVKVDTECPMTELLGLLNGVPFDYFCTPGTDQVSYSTLAELFKSDSDVKEVTMQVMVLGSHYGFWELVNPYDSMTNTKESTRLLLAAMGNFSVKISPGYLKNCMELISNIESLNKSQVASGQSFLS
jgi:hypothetical protein